MIDSHCHLADKKFEKDLPDAISRAKTAGISQMITIADSLPEATRCIEIAEAHAEIFATVGVHPHNAKDWNDADAEKLEALVASSKKVKAIGEIGLDYHYDFSPRDLQITALGQQLAIAQDLNLPVVIHNRESIADLKEILKQFPKIRFVLHCCTEKWNDVKDLVDAGGLLSFTGIATYPDANDIRETITNCPLEQMMIETDAPYLTPVPHRGKRNEPSFVVHVAEAIAKIKDVSLDEVDRATTQNAINFFGLLP